MANNISEIDYEALGKDNSGLSDLLWARLLERPVEDAERSAAVRAIHMLNSADNVVSQLLHGQRVEDYDQLSQSEVIKSLGHTARHLDTLVAEGWLKAPIQRRPGGTWYYDKADVIEYKLGIKYQEYLRDAKSKTFDDKPDDVQKGLAPFKPTLRPSRRRLPPKK